MVYYASHRLPSFSPEPNPSRFPMRDTMEFLADEGTARAFQQFARRVAHRLEPSIVGSHVARVEVVNVEDGRTGGWFCPLLELRDDPETSVELWFDRYLDPEGAPALSCWVHGRAQTIKQVSERARHAAGWGAAVVFKAGSRLPSGRALRTPPLPIVVAAPMLDHWRTEQGDYFGRFLCDTFDDPLGDSAVDVAVACIAQLADLATQGDPPSGGDDPDHNAASLDVPTWAAIKQRRGQTRFRNILLAHFKERCVISGTGIVSLLEAAHIRPHARGGSSTVDNGLLLRADLHTLFDLGMLTLEVQGAEIVVALPPDVRCESPYQGLHGRKVTAPITRGQRLALLERNRLRAASMTRG